MTDENRLARQLNLRDDKEMNDQTINAMDVRETATLQAQIDETSAHGGGRITLPPGIHRCGTLILKSGVELHLEEGAVLEGGTQQEDYDDVIPNDMVYHYGDANATPTVTRKALVFAENAENIAITGKGEIHIDGPQFFDRTKTFWNYFWPKPAQPRPRTVVMRGCRNIRFEGVTFRDCPLWTMWLRLCENIDVNGISVDCEQRMINADGIDFDGCRHVRVRDSRFKTGDDCIVLRAITLGSPDEGPVITEDVIVENCVLDSLCQGVRIGCPSDDTVRDALFRNITFRGRNGIVSEQPRHYLNAGNNGYLQTEGIVFENCEIECFEHPIWISVSPGIELRNFGHMTFRDIRVKAKESFVVKGSADSHVRGVRFENIRGTVEAKTPFEIENAPGIEMSGIEVICK